MIPRRRRIGPFHKHWSLWFNPGEIWIGARHDWQADRWDFCLIPTIVLRVWWI